MTTPRRLLALTLSMATVLGLSSLVHVMSVKHAQAQVLATYGPFTPGACPAGGASPCFDCNVNPSPVNPSTGLTYGCTWGQPPIGSVIGACNTFVPAGTCSNRLFGCGSYNTCTFPPVAVAACTGSYLSCP